MATLPESPRRLFRVDMHVHSCYSRDSGLQIRTLLETAQGKGLNGVAVTDHGTAAGGFAAAEANSASSFLVIPGAEYATDAGHILGLFLTSEPQLGKRGRHPWQGVVEAIHTQGGLAFIAHPFKRRRQLPPSLLDALDGMETFNARAGHAGNSRANQEAAVEAARYGLPAIGGSDAHWAGEIGRGYWETQEITGSPSLEEVRRLIMQGKGVIGGTPTPLLWETCSQLFKVKQLKEYQRVPRIVAKFILRCAGFRVGRGRGGS